MILMVSHTRRARVSGGCHQALNGAIWEAHALQAKHGTSLSTDGDFKVCSIVLHGCKTMILLENSFRRGIFNFKFH